MTKQKYLAERIKKLRPRQKLAFEAMLNSDLKQLRYPCSFGKGFLIFTHMLHQAVNTDDKVFAICSHRLGLNDQHITDAFNIFLPLLGEVAYLYVGSTGGLEASEIDAEDALNNFAINKAIQKLNKKNTKKGITNISLGSIIGNATTSSAKIAEFVKEHKGKTIIIVSTYNSLGRLNHPDIPLNVLYCDEAHELASGFTNANKADSFISNYKSIICPKKYFFSATPKDCSGDPDNTYLMNNTQFFGDAIGMSHVESVEEGYALDLQISCICPDIYDSDHNIDFDSSKTKAKLVLESFGKHRLFLREKSHFPDRIGGKMLVRCASVMKDMWPIFKILETTDLNIKIFACASKDRDGTTTNSRHMMWYNGVAKHYANKKAFIKAINDLPSTDEAIILHHDTLSEGINIPGFTCFLPFTDTLITNAKFIQNLGRILRLNAEDAKLFFAGVLKLREIGWVKPMAHLILPYWSNISNAARNIMKDMILHLMRELDAELGDSIPFGDDSPTGTEAPEDKRSLSKEEKEKMEFIGVFYEDINRDWDLHLDEFEIHKINQGVKDMTEDELGLELLNHLNSL